MRRRRFLQVAGAGLVANGSVRAEGSGVDPGSPDIIERLVRANDARIPALLERQETEPSHPWRGAVHDEHAVHSAGGTAGLVQALVAALAARGSRYQGSPEIGGRLALAARALLALQHADGTIDLPSTNFHSPTCDRALLTVARLLDRAALLEPVRRNLEMTLWYLHADGDVATEASRRQDQYRRGSPAGYHLPYRSLALRDGNGRFAAAARLIEAKEGDALAGHLIHFLDDPSLGQRLPPEAPLPDAFARHFPGSDLVRIRRGPVSATLLGGNSCVLSFHKGPAALEAVRLASAFFGKGQFAADRLEVEGSRYVLTQSLTGPYYQPLAPQTRRPDGAWDPADRARRRHSEVQALVSRLVVRESAGAFEIDVNVAGTDRVPLAIELGFRRGGTLAGVEPLPGTPDAFLLREGTGEYRAGGETIRFGTGGAAHTWIDLRGALPKLDALSVYVTGFTPYRTTLRIG